MMRLIKRRKRRGGIAAIIVTIIIVLICLVSIPMLKATSNTNADVVKKNNAAISSFSNTTHGFLDANTAGSTEHPYK